MGLSTNQALVWEDAFSAPGLLGEAGSAPFRSDRRLTGLGVNGRSPVC